MDGLHSALVSREETIREGSRAARYGEKTMKRLRIWISALGLCFAASVPNWAQTTEKPRTMPSQAEWAEIVNKADENVKELAKALMAAKPWLSEDYIKRPAEDIVTAEVLCEGIRRKGMTIYALVSLLYTLDDLTYQASQATRRIILFLAQNNIRPSSRTSDEVVPLVNGEVSLHVSSVTLTDAGLRFAGAEDDQMAQIVKPSK